MRQWFIQKNSILFLIACLALCSVSQFFLLPAYRKFINVNASTTSATAKSKVIVPTPPSLTQVPELSRNCNLQHSSFETGIAFPQWNPDGYGSNDVHWLMGLQAINSQVGACWIEMPVLFYQQSLTSTTVIAGPSTPTLASFSYGVRLAHALGYQIFVTPLIDVEGTQSWSGSIYFSTYQEEQQWFESYWQILKPYATVAAQNGAGQISIGTEYEWLQKNAPDDLWNTLIANIRSVFPGMITYDMNWTTLQDAPRLWMRNPTLKTIGVSAYLPLIDIRSHVDPTQIFSLWRDTVRQALDVFATTLGKPVLISEIGYRNSADALYHSWESTSTAPTDPQEQAAACDAALANVISDTHILGIFFWGWDDVGAFNLVGQPAVKVIHDRFMTLQING